uniref:Uncharacterized protein n=1 Tax=Anguilla anguilla TaxID=7936 RepID=A0A0E9WX17_ANGAN
MGGGVIIMAVCATTPRAISRMILKEESHHTKGLWVSNNMDSAEPANNFPSRCHSLAHGAKHDPHTWPAFLNPALNNCIQVSRVWRGNAINFPHNPPTRVCDSNPMCTRVTILKPQLKDISNQT